MNFLPKIRKPLAVVMVLTFTGLTVVWAPAQATMVGTSQILKQNHQENNRDRLRNLFDRVVGVFQGLEAPLRTLEKKTTALLFRLALGCCCHLAVPFDQTLSLALPNSCRNIG